MPHRTPALFKSSKARALFGKHDHRIRNAPRAVCAAAPNIARLIWQGELATSTVCSHEAIATWPTPVSAKMRRDPPSKATHVLQ